MGVDDGPAADGDVSDSSRSKNARAQTQGHEVETNADSRGKAPPPPPPSRAPSSAAVPAESNWQRKRSSLLLLNAMHPEGARETATFVERLPGSTALRVLLALFAYALLVSDVPRAGSSVDSLPFEQIEPNVFTVYGPTALPGRTIFRNGTAVTNGVSTGVSTALYKFTPSSYGLRTARDLLEASPKLDSSWPACILSAHSAHSAYSSDCAGSLPGTTVFNMLDTLVEALAANAPSTTSYKNVAQTDDGIALMTRGELSAFPQRVCFAARAKARWTGTSSAASGSTAASSSTSFLSRNLLDHKYWLSVWATTFADLDPTNRGVDLCVDDLDRPLFCEKPWAASLAVDGSESEALWETVSSRAATLQKTLAKSEKLDVTLVETESDPLTRLGGAVLLAHKIYNVVALYRIRECTDAGVCTTTTVFDERVEGKVLYTDALEWSSLASTLRFIGQMYVIVRVCLLVACYAVVGSAVGKIASTGTSRLTRTLQVFFAVPSQVVVYGSWLPVLCYASAHIIDALILYELEDDGGESATDSFSALTHWLAVHMRSVWLMALLARVRALLQTSAGAWTPSHGVSGVRGHLLPALALGAVAFVAHGGIAVDDRDARILEANEVEPVPTFMLLRTETLDAWKMNLEGVYSDMLAVALAAIIYVVVILAVRALMRWHRRRWVKPTNFSQANSQAKGDAVPDPLFFARSAVPSAAGALWEPSCLSVSWDDDLLGPLLGMLTASTPWLSQRSQRNTDKKQGSSEAGTDANLAANGDEIATSSASTTQRMLMNLVFLSDPWNLLVLKLGRARVHLYQLRGSGLDCKVVHANAKARVARKYSLALENVELIASLRASELSWSQLVTCK